MKVADIMTRKVHSLSPEMSVKEAAQFFLRKKISGAPVVDSQGKLVGIVTESDLIMEEVKLQFPTFFHLLDGFIFLSNWRDYEEKLRKAVGLKVGEVMSSPVITVEADASVEEAATLMIEKQVSRLPVVDKGRMVGIVSKRDLVKAIADVTRL